MMERLRVKKQHVSCIPSALEVPLLLTSQNVTPEDYRRIRRISCSTQSIFAVVISANRRSFVIHKHSRNVCMISQRKSTKRYLSNEEEVVARGNQITL